MQYRITVHRDPNQFRLRKWVVNLIILNEKTSDSVSVDKRFLFGGLFFQARLKRKIKRMIEMRAKVDYIVSTFTPKN